MIERITNLKSLINGPVLITGHTGFKGTWLTLLLKELGIPVIGISKIPTNDSLYQRLNKENQIEGEFSDIRNYPALENFIEIHKPSTVIHLAAQALVFESYEDPLGTFETNVNGTANLLDIAVKNQNIKAVVVATTDKVYKNLNTGEKYKETDQLEGSEPYSASKVATESVVKAWQVLAQRNKCLNISVVRAGNVIGGGDMAANRLIPDIVRSYINKRTLDIRSPDSTRPWQHVLDPVFGYLLVLEKTLRLKQNFTFNFSAEEASITVQNVCDIFLETWKPHFNYRIASNIDDIYYESKLLDLDSSKARSELGWESQFSQQMAIEQTAIWWTEYLTQNQSADYLCKKEIINYLENL